MLERDKGAARPFLKEPFDLRAENSGTKVQTLARADPPRSNSETAVHLKTESECALGAVSAAEITELG